MNNCEYKEIGDQRAGPRDVSGRARWTKKPLFRQMMVATCVWSSFFQLGLSAGTPPVLAAQLRRDASSTGAYDDEAASWFNSTSSFTAAVCVVLMALLCERCGRRLAYLLMCITTCASFVVFYFATSYHLLIFSQILLGPLLGGTSNVCHMIFAEYISPKYRGVFLAIKGATVYWAVWVANAVGTFFHWRNIGVFGIACALYNTSLLYFWPESPFWLASKNRIEECQEAHRWLRGNDDSSEKELKCLIDSEEKKTKRFKGDTKCKSRFAVWLQLKNRFALWLKKMSAPQFYLPMLLCVLLVITDFNSGKIVLTMYSLDIISKITKDDAAAYTHMLVLDGITVLGMYVGCGVSRYVNRRTLFFSTEFAAVMFLFMISIHLYLIKLGLLTENVYVSLFFLLAFSLSVSCGTMILTMAIVAEIYPLELRSFAAVLENVIANIVRGVYLKFSPLLFSALGLHGGFLCFAVGSLVCALLLFKYLPETKDKTLKEIESLFKKKDKLKLIKEKELMTITAPEFYQEQETINLKAQ